MGGLIWERIGTNSMGNRAPPRVTLGLMWVGLRMNGVGLVGGDVLGVVEEGVVGDDDDGGWGEIWFWNLLLRLNLRGVVWI